MKCDLFSLFLLFTIIFLIALCELHRKISRNRGKGSVYSKVFNKKGTKGPTTRGINEWFEIRLCLVQYIRVVVYNNSGYEMTIKVPR